MTKSMGRPHAYSTHPLPPFQAHVRVAPFLPQYYHALSRDSDIQVHSCNLRSSPPINPCLFFSCRVSPCFYLTTKPALKLTTDCSNWIALPPRVSWFPTVTARPLSLAAGRVWVCTSTDLCR